MRILQYEDFDVKKQFCIGNADFQVLLKQKGYTIFACRTSSLRSMTKEVVGMACGRADPKIRETDEVPFQWHLWSTGRKTVTVTYPYISQYRFDSTLSVSLSILLARLLFLMRLVIQN